MHDMILFHCKDSQAII